MVAAVVTVGICASAYISEIWRGAIAALPRGQSEAAAAIGMGPLDIWTRVILPQAISLSLPALVNELILLVKASSLVSVVGILEITRSSQALAATTFRPLEVYIAAAMSKKKVPVVVTKNPEHADLVLTTSGVEIQKQSTGSKIARCLFMYCGGIEDRGTTSVNRPSAAKPASRAAILTRSLSSGAIRSEAFRRPGPGTGRGLISLDRRKAAMASS